MTPWRLDEWKNRSLPLPVLMNPKPFSVNFLIVPSAISSLPIVIAWIDAARLTFADWPPSIWLRQCSPATVPSRKGVPQVLPGLLLRKRLTVRRKRLHHQRIAVEMVDVGKVSQRKGAAGEAGCGELANGLGCWCGPVYFANGSM